MMIAELDTEDEIVEEETDNFDMKDVAAERAAVWKVDRNIFPILFLLYFFNFLDRVNLGNGRLFGLESDLGLKNNQFQTATSLLFVTYITVQTPATIFFTKLRPRFFVGALGIAWGLIATLTGLTQNYAQLAACRLLLGLMEGPLAPCLVAYLNLFYTRQEMLVRFGYLIIGAACSGAFGGLIAYGVGHMDGVHGYRAWRWLLIIEGLPSIGVGVFALFWLSNGPDCAHYLSRTEKNLILIRQTRDMREAMTPSSRVLHRADVIAAFKDWRVWALGFQNFGGDLQLFSYSIFLPTIIKSINPAWSSLTVQVLTVPCYVLGAFVYFLAAWTSQATRKRAIFCILGCLISIVGHIMLIAGHGTGVPYAGCYFIAMGIYTVSGIVLVWLPSNLPRYGKRSAGIGIMYTVGTSAGVAAPYLYATGDEPRFVKGHAVTIGLLVLSMTLTAAVWASYARANAERKAGYEDRKMAGLTEEEIDDLGDDSPRFRYMK